MINAVEVKDYSVYAPGQFVVIEQYFQSSESLAGKDMLIGVKFSEYENCEDDRPSGLIKFKMPFGAGTTDIPISNQKLTVESIDDKRFKVIYEFFNTGSVSNTSGCATTESPAILGIAVGYEKKIELTQVQKDQDPCRVSNLCWIGNCANITMQAATFQQTPTIHYFDGDGNALNGYNLDGATQLRFELSGAIGNTFYLSFCNSYAAINTGVSQVGDLPMGPITGGKGFQSRSGSAYYGTATISQVAGSSGYIVYSNGCTWQAAKFTLVPNTLNNTQPENYPVTYGDVACELTVNETVVTDCCIGVYPGQSVNVELTMDVAEYNAMIVSNGTYGTYATNFVSAGVCISESPVLPDSECDGAVDHSGGVVNWSGTVDSGWSGMPIYLNFQWRFSIVTPEGVYEDVINKAVLLNVGSETAIGLTSFNDEGGTPITGTYCLDQNSLITALISGESGQNFSITSEDGLSVTPSSGVFGATDTELSISTEGLEPFGNYCFTVEGEGAVDGSGDNPADCGTGCTQFEISMNVTDSGPSGWKATVSVTATGVNIGQVFINQEVTAGATANYEWSEYGNPAIATVPLNIGMFTTDGCVYFAQGFIEAENKIGATNMGVAVGCTDFEIPFEGSTCQNNNPGISVSCMNGSMDISSTGSVGSVVSDVLQFSGGGTSSSERFDLATRTIDTSDCGVIVINECFNCESEPDWEQMEECEENQDIAIIWTFDDLMSELTLTADGAPTSPLTDTMYYSLDDGATFAEYTMVVTVPIGVTDIPIKRVATFAICDDAVYEEIIILPGSENACQSSPELEATYNELTDNHKAVKQGNVYNVFTDEVFFSTDLGASFEPYTGPVAGNFVIFQRVVTFTNDCEDIIIIKGSAKPIEGVQVNIPAIDVNINETVTVDCCDGETEFQSNNTVTCNDEV